MNTVEIIPTTLTYGGDALGRLDDGRAVFVPFVLPGERVRVEIVEEKRGHVRARLVEVLQQSPERISPKCKHFGVCGGCHYQNLPYEAQLKVKTEILRDQLTRIGKIENPPVKNAVASPNQWNYRNHIQFHLDRNGKLGFLAPNSNKVIPVSECHLPESSINELWPQLELEPNDEIERVSIRVGIDDDLMLILESNVPEPPDLEIEASISITHLFEDHTAVIAGNDHIFTEVMDREFRVSAPSFFQVNTAMAGKMVDHLSSRIPISQATTLLDVYCGVGLFSSFFASKCKSIIGVEASPSACEDFVFNLDEFNNVELYEGLAEEILPSLKIQPEVILVDPPRAGIEKQALDAIVSMKPQVIAYVSCDPSTLARDAKRFIDAGYRLQDVTPFDLFPQTYHIESISIFTLA